MSPTLSPTLWAGIITIVVGLELVRVVMSTWVLLHILELPALRHDDTPDGQRRGPQQQSAQRSRQTARTRAELEGLLDPTLAALRNAANAPNQPQALAAADAALERYLHPLARLTEESGVGQERTRR